MVRSNGTNLFRGYVLFIFSQIGYISITANAVKNWRELWTDPATQLYHFIGKDNILFHTLHFPATLIGSGCGFQLPHFVSATHYLMFEGQKFSKSRGIGVFGTDAMNSTVESDVWRLALLRLRPESTDSDFTMKFLGDTREWLRKNIANLSSRITKFIATKHNNIIPEGSLDETEVGIVRGILADYHKAMDAVELREGVELAMKLTNEINAYLNRVQFWAQTGSHGCDVIYTAVNLLVWLSVVWSPFTPQLATDLRQQLGWTDPNDSFQLVPSGGVLPPTRHLIDK
jgi:methionyl-tRNA synthetase